MNRIDPSVTEDCSNALEGQEAEGTPDEDVSATNSETTQTEVKESVVGSQAIESEEDGRDDINNCEAIQMALEDDTTVNMLHDPAAESHGDSSAVDAKSISGVRVLQVEAVAIAVDSDAFVEEAAKRRQDLLDTDQMNVNNLRTERIKSLIHTQLRQAGEKATNLQKKFSDSKRSPHWPHPTYKCETANGGSKPVCSSGEDKDLG